MSDIKPTAKIIAHPNGDSVWIVTLNDYFKDEVQQEASWFAQGKMRRFRPGGSDHEQFVEEWQGKSPLDHAMFLAEYDGWKGVYRKAVDAKFPLPERPKIENFPEEQAFVDACTAWETSNEQLFKDRENYATEMANEAIRTYAKKPAKWRREMCMKADFNRQFSKIFGKRAVMETIYRATRTEEDQLKFYYRSVEQVIAESNEVHDLLITAYEEVDPYTPEDIPTSPDVS